MPMKFKEFFVLSERKYFADLLEKSVKTVDQLERKLKKTWSIKSGTRIEVDGIKFVFYKRGKNKDTFAVYNRNNLIKIYVNNFYGENENFNFLKNGFPPRLRNLLIHELSHAEEDHNEVLDHGMLPDIDTNDKSYYNSTTEVNARIVAYLEENLTDYVLRLAKQGKTQDAFRVIIKKMRNTQDFKNSTDDNKKRYIKTMYSTFLKILDDKLKILDI